ncbi:MAG: amino acid adenylation domain-containing protein [Bryobacteraceae bacterium]|nr:amino acid adenylation domain-containing protein [Bryobacteraceae bacterium]
MSAAESSPPLAAGSAGVRAASRIPRRAFSGPAVLSTAQKRIWLLHEFDPASPISNRPLALRLSGALDVEVLARALNEIARRHETLRTVFPPQDGEPRQVVMPPAPVPIETRDLTGIPPEAREGEARRIAATEASRPFDLASGPLFRVILLRLRGEEHALLALMHHIIFDGWSETVFVNELKTLYRSFARNDASPLAAPPIQYSDFAAWQQQRWNDAALAPQLEYWRRKLAGAPASLKLPADRDAPAGRSYRSGSHACTLAADLTAALKRVSRLERVSLFMTLLAGLQLLLTRYAGQEDIVIGVPIAGRGRVETEELIGCFMNVLVFRTQITPELTARELLARVRETALGAYANQEAPFEKIVEELRPERHPDRWPFFQTMFQLRNLPARETVEVEQLRFERFEFDSGVIGGLDLSVEAKEAPEGLRCAFRYDARLFEDATIYRMIGHYRNLLEAIVAERDRRVSLLPMLRPEERRRVVVEWNETGREFDEQARVHELFEQQAERRPEATAVIWDSGRLTYGELNRRANRAAHRLLARGARPDARVAISIERSPALVIGLLAILKAGAAYVPLDPAHPKDRRDFVVRDAGSAMGITGEWIAEALASGAPDHNPRSPGSGRNLAYVIYTSGTTGRPKGVMVSHRAVVNHLLWRQRYFALNENDRLLQRASASFDDSVWEFFEPLASGAALVLADPGREGETDYLVDLMARHKVTAACFIPSQLQILLDEPRLTELTLLRRVTTGAETLPLGVPERFSERLRADLFNGYGPTEATVACAYYRCEPVRKLRTVPIGRPIDNARVYVLDRQLEPVPPGVPGELYIGGDGLARGYINQPGLTAERFIPDPFRAGGERLYRTGDLARYLPDGHIEFLGRVDEQVKIRGYRIEPGEVEAALAECPEVRRAAVTVWEPPGGAKALAAYVAPRDGASLTRSGLREFARQRLPEYMMPSDWIVLDDFPLLPNGKVNRVALPPPVRARSASPESEAPRNKLEARLKAIWEETLRLRRVGVRDNFFDLGGHSLLAVKVFTRIEREMGLRLPLAALLAAPTIEQLAETIAEKGYEASWASLVPIQPRGSRLPLYCAHGNDGDVLFYRELALRLGEDQPLYGLQSAGLRDVAGMPRTVEALAALYVDEVRTLQPRGPYCLAGYCMGAYLALEMARQMQAAGERVGLLAAINTDGEWKTVEGVGGSVGYHARRAEGGIAGVVSYFGRRGRLRFERMMDVAAASIASAGASAGWNGGGRLAQRLHARRLRAYHVDASRGYRPAAAYRGPLVYLRGSEERADYRAFWGGAVDGEIVERVAPGKGIEVLREPNVQVLAAQLREFLDGARS